MHDNIAAARSFLNMTFLPQVHVRTAPFSGPALSHIAQNSGVRNTLPFLLELFASYMCHTDGNTTGFIRVLCFQVSYGGTSSPLV